MTSGMECGIASDPTRADPPFDGYRGYQWIQWEIWVFGDEPVNVYIYIIYIYIIHIYYIYIYVCLNI